MHSYKASHGKLILCLEYNNSILCAWSNEVILWDMLNISAHIT